MQHSNNGKTHRGSHTPVDNSENTHYTQRQTDYERMDMEMDNAKTIKEMNAIESKYRIDRTRNLMSVQDRYLNNEMARDRIKNSFKPIDYARFDQEMDLQKQLRESNFQKRKNVQTTDALGSLIKETATNSDPLSSQLDEQGEFDNVQPRSFESDSMPGASHRGSSRGMNGSMETRERRTANRNIMPRGGDVSYQSRNAVNSALFSLDTTARQVSDLVGQDNEHQTKYQFGAVEHSSGLLLGMSQDDIEDKVAEKKANDSNAKNHADNVGKKILFGELGDTASAAGAVMMAAQDETEMKDTVEVDLPEGTTQLMNLENFTFRSMFSRQICVSSFDWASTATQAQQIYNGNVIDIFGAHPYVPILQKFTFARWEKMRIQFQYEANPFYSGVLKALFVPGMMSYVDGVLALNSGQLMTTSRGELMYACSNEEIVINCDWMFPKDWIAINYQGDTESGMQARILEEVLGSVRVQVVHPLVAPEGSSATLNINVLVSFEGLEVAVPTGDPIDTLNPAPMQGAADNWREIIENNLTKAYSNLDLLLYEIPEIYAVVPKFALLKQKAIEEAVMCSSNILHVIESLPREAPHNLATRDEIHQQYIFLLAMYERTVIISLCISEIQRVINSLPQPYRDEFIVFVPELNIAKKHNLQIRVPINEMLMHYREIPIMQSAQEMFYYPTTNRFNTHEHSATFSSDMAEARSSGYTGPMDETEVRFLSNIFNYERTVNILSTMTKGTIIRSHRVTPNTNTSRFSWTPLFENATYWAGSLVYKLVFAKNIFHKGKLIVFWTPTPITTTMNLDQMTQYPYIVLDLSQKNSFTFRVAEMTTLSTRRTRDLLDTTGDFSPDRYNGNINIAVYVPLITTTGQSVSIPMSLWHACYPGDDKGSHRFRLFTPRYARDWNRNTNAPLQGGWECQSYDMLLGIDIVDSNVVGTELEELTGGQMLFKKKQVMKVAKAVAGSTNSLPPLNVEVTGSVPRVPFDDYSYKIYPDQYISRMASNYAFWGGDFNYIIESNVDVNLVRQVPNMISLPRGSTTAPREQNWNAHSNYTFGAGPGMMMIKNGSQMLTVNAQNYSKYKMQLTGRRAQVAAETDIAETSQLFFGSQILIDSYDSETLKPATECVIFTSAGPNFWMGGYQGTSDKNNIDDVVYAEATLPTPTNDLLPIKELQMFDREFADTLNEAPMQAAKGGGYFSYLRDMNNVKNPPISTISGAISTDATAGTSTGTTTIENAEDDSDDDDHVRFVSRSPSETKKDGIFTILKETPQQLRDTLRQIEMSATNMSSNVEVVTDNLSDGFRDLRRDMSRTTASLEKIENKFDETATKAGGTFDRINAFMDNIKDKGLLQAIGLDSSDAALVAVLALDLCASLKKNKLKRWVEFGLKVASAIGIKFFQLSKVISICYNFLGREQGPNGSPMQSGLSTPSMATAVTICVMAIAFKTTGGDEVDEKKVKTTWDFLSVKGRDLANMKMGVSSFMEGFSAIRGLVVEGLKEYVFADDEEALELLSTSEINSKMSELARDLRKYSDPKNRYKMTYWGPIKVEFLESYRDLIMLEETLHLVKVDPSLWQRFGSLKRAYEKLSDGGLDNMDSPQVRHDIFHVSFVGGTKMGKSTIALSTGRILALSQKFGEDGKHPLVYTRSINTEFNDNYCGQPVLFIDDIDATHTDQSVAEQIERKSNVPVNLNMARLEKKGVQLISKIMVSTTNTAYPSPPQAKFPEAYQRRRDVLVSVANMPGQPKVPTIDHSHACFSIIPSLETEIGRNLPQDLTFPQLMWYLITQSGKFFKNQAELLMKYDRNSPVEKVYLYPQYNRIQDIPPEITRILKREAISPEIMESIDQGEHLIFVRDLPADDTLTEGNAHAGNVNGNVFQAAKDVQLTSIGIRRLAQAVTTIGVTSMSGADFMETLLENEDALKYMVVSENGGKVLDANSLFDDISPYLTEMSRESIQGLFIEEGYSFGVDWKKYGGKAEIILPQTHGFGYERIGITVFGNKPCVFGEIEGVREYMDYDNELGQLIISKYLEVLPEASNETKWELGRHLKRLYAMTEDTIIGMCDKAYDILASGLICLTLPPVTYPYMQGFGYECLTRWSLIAGKMRAKINHVMRIPRIKYEQFHAGLETGIGGAEAITVGIFRNIMLLFEIIVFTPITLTLLLRTAIHWLKGLITDYLTTKIGAASALLLTIFSLTIAYSHFNKASTEIFYNDVKKSRMEGGKMIIQGYDHKDLTFDGGIQSHVHLCEKCGDVYSHRHEKHTEEESRRYTLICRVCRRKELNDAINASYTRTQDVDIEMDEEMTIKKEDGVEFTVLEGAKSYPDEKGNKKPRRVVRLEGAYLEEVRKKTKNLFEDFERIHAKSIKVISDVTKVKHFDHWMDSLYADRIFILFKNKGRAHAVSNKLRVFDFCNRYLFNGTLAATEENYAAADRKLVRDTFINLINEGKLEENKSGELDFKSPTFLMEFLEKEKKPVEAKKVEMEVAYSTPDQTYIKDFVPKMEACTDNQTQQIAAKARMNQGIIYYGGMWMTYVGLCEKKILVNAHLFTGSQNLPHYTVTIERLGQYYSVMVPKSDVRRLPEINSVVSRTGTARPDEMVLDLCANKQIPPFTNIVPYFIREADLYDVDGWPGKMVCRERTDKQMAEGIHYESFTSFELGRITADLRKTTEGPKGDFYYSAVQWKYSATTNVGNCGSPIYHYNTHIPRKIIGIHQAGIGTDSYAVMVTAETLKKLLGVRTSIDGPSIDDILSDVQLQVAPLRVPRILPPGKHIIVGTLNKAGVVPRKTDIRCTPIFNKVSEHKTEPAILRKHDPRNESGAMPLEKGLNKFNQNSGDWNPYFLKMAEEEITKEVIKYTEEKYGGPKRLLTVDEAVNGIVGWVTPVDMYTSAGFPYNKQKPANSVGKLHLFERIGERDDGSPLYKPKKELQDDIEYLLKNVKEYKVVRNFFTDEMKDERRPLEKIKDCKTRIFNTHSVAWQIVTKMYYGAFASMYMQAKLHLSSTLGINVHGPDVTQLVNHLLSVGNNMFPGDVSRWDGSYDFETAETCARIASSWLKNFNDELDFWELMTVGSTFQFRIHIVGDTVYITFIGMPSGWFLTAIFNTLGNNVRKIVVIFEVALKQRKTECINFTYIRENYRDVRNGDDLVESVSDEMKKWYTVDKIIETWGEHGIELTSPTKMKGVTVEDYCDIEAVQYLKSTFIKDDRFPYLWKMAMSKTTIEELFNWIRRGSDYKERLESNVMDAMRFAYGHGQEYFSDIEKRLKSALSSVNLSIVVPSYREFDANWLGEHGMFQELAVGQD
jgi:hypothetical protein